MDRHDAASLTPGPGGERRTGALARYRVLELGSLVAGPFCGSFLADFGAEVIKAEQIEGDPVRSMGECFEGKSLFGASIMRNKRLICVDLRSPEGAEIVRELAAGCDVVIENFRPGVLERWGLGYEDLRKLNPSIVMTRVSGFGQDGPYASRPGFGVIGEAVSGLRHLIGDPDRPPARAALPLTDYVAGMYAAMGTLVAIVHRERTGEGQCVDASLFESAFSFMRSEVPAFDKLGKIANRAGSRLPGHVPSNLFRTRDGGYIHISAPSDSLFRRLCAVMGRPELADDPRFADPIERRKHEDALEAIIAGWVGMRDLDEAEAALIGAQVVASRIFTVADIFNDPHFKARGMLVEVPDDDLDSLVLPGVVPKLSLTPGSLTRTGGANGRDTEQVLLQYTSLTLERIRALEAKGVIHQADCEPAEFIPHADSAGTAGAAA